MRKKLCLNMIVKNEMANLERCLGAIADHVDCWVIGDTGSTDGTQKFIKSFFAARSIRGELYDFPFRNFEQARNAALDCATASNLAYDYLLFADADMELVVKDKLFRDALEAPGYRLLQRTDPGLAYWNTRLVQRNTNARYRCVTHEYLDGPEGVSELNDIWYRDHASGSNRVDKVERDIKLLTEALAHEPDPYLRSRYTFYLAQSYRDAGENQKALSYFLRRADLVDWAEEVFMSLYAAGQIQEAMERPFEEVIGTYLRACDAVPTRAEAFHAASRFCRARNKFAEGFEYAQRGLTIPLSTRGLFVATWVYEYGLRDEFAINAYWIERYEDCIDACEQLLRADGIPKQVRERAASYRTRARAKLNSRDRALTEQKMIDFVPKPAIDIEMETIEGEVLLYDPQRTRAVYLNPTAALVWHLCDGNRSVRDIIRLIEASYPDAVATITNDVLVTLKELQESEILVVG